MPSKDLSFKAFTTLHKVVYRLSGGKVAGKAMGMPVVILTTVGRKSGRARETMLTSPLEQGDSVILVASFGGDDRHPAWYLNLSGNPEVELTIRGQHKKMKARVAQGTERDELWAHLTADHANYAGYQTKTNRQIPVVVLSPA